MQPLLDERELTDLQERLARTRWTDVGAVNWDTGVPDHWLKDLIEAWQQFDVSTFQNQLNALSHLSVDVDGQQVHLVHALGRGPDPLPLVLTHGWPGSFVEFLEIIPLLTNPQAHGGDSADAFTVVVPSLPGFGFSASPPSGGLTAQQVAALWHSLMVDGLGYRRYGAHGSDLGAGVTARLAREHPEAVVGIHLATPGLAVPPAPWSPAEAEHVTQLERWTAEEGSALPADDPSPVPAAISIFGGERVPFPKPPRQLAERYFTVTSWAKHERGGHLSAVAEPKLLAQTLRDVFRPLRLNA